MNTGTTELVISQYVGISLVLHLFIEHRSSPFKRCAGMVAICSMLLLTSLPSPGDDNTDRIMKTARAAIKKKNFQAAIKLCTEVIAKEPQNGDAYLTRGIALEWLDKSAAAAKDFDKGLNLTTPQSSVFFEQAANAYNDTRQTQKALKILDEGIRTHPASALFRDKGQILWQLGKRDESLACFEKAIEFAPKEYWIYADRANCYMQMKNWKSALADLNTMVKLRPTEPRTYAQRALVYETLGEKENATKDRVKAKELSKDAWFEP